MKKCKICGQYFDYHITNAHLESHGITRKEYKQIPEKDDVFVIGRSNYNKTDDDVNGHVSDTINRNRRKRNLYMQSRV